MSGDAPATVASATVEEQAAPGGEEETPGETAETRATAKGWWRAAATVELPPGSRRIVEHDSRRVLLLNVEGRVFAFESLCPHQQYPLDFCQVVDGCLECPFHQFRYRLETGENEYPASVYPAHLPYLKAQLRPLTRFETRTDDDVILIAPVDDGDGVKERGKGAA